MKGPTKQEKRESIESFIPLEEKSAPVVVRRTRLEQFTVCPFMANAIEKGRCIDMSELTEIGEAVHQAIALATADYVESESGMPFEDLLDEARNNLISTRPDILPKAVAHGERALWAWARYVSKLPARTILAFDGGDRVLHPDDPSKTRTGQLAWTVAGAGPSDYIVTAEFDLLHSTRSPEVLAEIDYKSGWKQWNYDDLAESFQFSLHAWLVFKNYPSVNYLDSRVWLTRSNKLTPVMRFQRSEMPLYDARVRQALSYHSMYAGFDNPPAWPYPEKCSICPCSLQCPHSMASHNEVAAGPAAAVGRLVVLQEAVKAQKEALKSYVDLTGVDIVTESGTCFGRDKPSAERWPVDPVYLTPEAIAKEKAAKAAAKAKSKPTKPRESKSAKNKSGSVSQKE